MIQVSSCDVTASNDGHGEGSSGSIPRVDTFKPIFYFSPYMIIANTKTLLYYFHN